MGRGKKNLRTFFVGSGQQQGGLVDAPSLLRNGRSGKRPIFFRKNSGSRGSLRSRLVRWGAAHSRPRRAAPVAGFSRRPEGQRRANKKKKGWPGGYPGHTPRVRSSNVGKAINLVSYLRHWNPPWHPPGRPQKSRPFRSCSEFTLRVFESPKT